MFYWKLPDWAENSNLQTFPFIANQESFHADWHNNPNCKKVLLVKNQQVYCIVEIEGEHLILFNFVYNELSSVLNGYTQTIQPN